MTHRCPVCDYECDCPFVDATHSAEDWCVHDCDEDEDKPRKQIERKPMKPRAGKVWKTLERKSMVTSKPRKGSRREIVLDLDAEVRRIVRARDKRCVTPSRFSPCHGRLEVSHFLRRGYQRIRWDLRNCNLQCQFHNQNHNEDTSAYYVFMVLKYGQGLLDSLNWSAYKNQTPLTYGELQTELERLRAIK